MSTMKGQSKYRKEISSKSLLILLTRKGCFLTKYGKEEQDGLILESLSSLNLFELRIAIPMSVSKMLQMRKYRK